MSESFPAPTPTPVPLKRQSKPTSVVTACQQMKFGPNLEGKEHESSRLFRYKRNLHEKDLAFSTDNEKKVVWIIGRFLASAQIGSTIIRKYVNIETTFFLQITVSLTKHNF